MEQMDLPYFDDHVKIIDAFDMMSESGEHAVVIRHQSTQYRLYTNALLIEGLQNGMTDCRELADLAGEPIVEVTPGDFGRNPSLFYQDVLVNKMDQEGHLYAVIDPVNPSQSRSIHIFTRHETLKYALQQAQTCCYCTVSPKHKVDMVKKACRVCSGPLKCG